MAYSHRVPNQVTGTAGHIERQEPLDGPMLEINKLVNDLSYMLAMD